ncbi:MAG: YMGG-like glycine zipper-containing protein [Rhodoblastus sp.]
MRRSIPALCAVSLGALALGGCASTMPAEPQVMVMPGKGKSYTAFQRDDDYCQSSAQAAVGYRSPGQASNDQTVGGAAVGTAVGALAGAAIGAAAGNAGTGALVGAGAGLAGGSIVGAQNGRRAGGAIQGRYDRAYAQCMVSRGHRMSEPEVEPVVVVDEPPPVYVYPRPYYWGPGVYYGPPRPYYRRGWW